MSRVAVVGAGLCGATAAAALEQSGHQATVFDKGRAVGGRMSSKRTAAGYLDMGAQYFTARSAAFQAQVQSWLQAGCAEVWHCTTASLTYHDGQSTLERSADRQLRYVGTPSMHAPVKAVLAGMPVITDCRIQRLERVQQSWSVVSESAERYTGFDAVLLAIPPVQAQQLLMQSGLGELFVAPASLLEPCWAVALRAGASGQGDAIFCQHPKLRFVSHQANKAGRSDCYIVHFNAVFSREHVEQPEAFWFKQAVDILQIEFGIDTQIEPLAAHRWLYASQNAELQATGIIALPDQQIWLGGDWSNGGRVENAYLAGLDLATSVMQYSNRATVTA